jgi:hypothetical protein
MATASVALARLSVSVAIVAVAVAVAAKEGVSSGVGGNMFREKASGIGLRGDGIDNGCTEG